MTIFSSRSSNLSKSLKILQNIGSKASVLDENLLTSPKFHGNLSAHNPPPPPPKFGNLGCTYLPKKIEKIHEEGHEPKLHACTLLRKRIIPIHRVGVWNSSRILGSFVFLEYWECHSKILRSNLHHFLLFFSQLAITEVSEKRDCPLFHFWNPSKTVPSKEEQLASLYTVEP